MKPALVVLLLTALAFAGCTEEHAHDLTTLEVRFGGRQADIAQDVEAHLDDHPSLAKYQAANIPHPGFFNAHDQLEAWSQATGTPYVATSFNGSFGTGFFLNSIAGITASGSDAYWSLSINGEVSDKGMSDVELHAGDRVTWTYTPIEADAAPGDGAAALTVQPIEPTQEDRVRIAGTVGGDAKVTVQASRAGQVFFTQSIDATGDWTIDVSALPFGRSTVVVTADDGEDAESATLVAVRLATALVSAEFASAVPPRAAIEATLLVDIDAFLSAPHYVGQPIEHPPFANIHDVMATWNATVPILFSFHPSFGAGVESIDGHGALSDWCYDLNGATADLGITAQQFTPGDVIAWGGCVLV